jgi:hypothetical protein
LTAPSELSGELPTTSMILVTATGLLPSGLCAAYLGL